MEEDNLQLGPENSSSLWQQEGGHLHLVVLEMEGRVGVGLGSAPPRAASWGRPWVGPAKGGQPGHQQGGEYRHHAPLQEDDLQHLHLVVLEMEGRVGLASDGVLATGKLSSSS